MKKISDYRDGDALDLLADIMESAMVIFADPEIRKAFEKESVLKVATRAIKNHKGEVLEILARVDGVPVEDYHCNIFTLPARLIELLSNQELIGFFSEQAQTASSNVVSMPPMENTKETEKT